MDKPSKQKLIATYRQLAEERGGEPIGARVFERDAGFSPHYWKGGYWRSWSEFQVDAGYAPNSATEKTPDDILLRRFAELAIERNKLPTVADLMIKRNEDSSFPSKDTYRRWGNRDALLAKVAEFCEGEPQFSPVLILYKQGYSQNLDRRLEADNTKGFVYLLRSGKNFKIGRTNAIGRRLRELAIQLPLKPDTVHVIETDDPEGIEQYWHRRFAEKRKDGEWFAFTPEDIRAFKKRRFQ